jgi:hypothetical protein
MFIYTAHIPKRRLLAGGVTLLCCCAVIVTALVLSAAGAAVSASAEVKGIRDNDDRLSYLNELGWTVSEQPLSTEELLVPDAFDDSYADYLALQSEQGFDLTRYKGKQVTRYTYEIVNYPTGETGVQISLLLYKNTVIGGEVLSSATGQVLHGLAMPQSEASQSAQDTWASEDIWTEQIAA